MKQFLSTAVQMPPSRNDAAGAPNSAGSVPIFAPAWDASSADQRNDYGAAWTQPGFGQRRMLVAPSLRLRASATNRSLLRWLRAAELAAWEDADALALRALKQF